MELIALGVADGNILVKAMASSSTNSMTEKLRRKNTCTRQVLNVISWALNQQLLSTLVMMVRDITKQMRFLGTRFRG